jgi:hypothetical protein
MSQVPASRDYRIDLLRGLALAMIFVNHMPGNWLEHWTTRNFGFSDAAEVFVLLAGVAAAFAFFKKFEAGESLAVTGRVAKRGILLYGAHLLSTFGAVMLFWAFAIATQNPDALDLIDIAPLFADPWPGLVGIATGGHQLGYFNILPLYVVLLALLPAFLWLARRDLRLALAASIALYLAANLFDLAMPSYPTDGGWFFNPFAWQLMFVIGLSLGIMRMRGQSVAYNRYVYGAAVAYLAFAGVWVVMNIGGSLSFGVVPEFLATLHKSNLPLVRVLHVLAAAYVVVYSPIWDWLKRVPASFLLTAMGRHSLPVFVVGSWASMLGYIILVHTGGGRLLETALTIAGLLSMWAVAVGREARRRTAAPALATVRQPARDSEGRAITRDPSDVTAPA